jgi:hypothetical protein
MSDHWERLARDIEYAIWRAPGSKRVLSASERESLSRAIVEHLKRCNWTVRHGKAPALHPETWYRPPS